MVDNGASRDHGDDKQDRTPIGVGLLGTLNLKDTARTARAAERAGFESLWIAETQNRTDAVTAAATALAATQRIKIGTSAINVYTRNAALIGLTFAGLAKSYPGRVIAGIGVGSASTLAAAGLQVTHPIGMLSEYVDVLRAITSDVGPITYRGRYVTLDQYEHGCEVQQQPEVMLCVGGPQALRLAGRKASGVVLDLFLPPGVIASQAARARGYASHDFTVAAGIMTSLDDDLPAAMDRVRPTLASYIVKFPELVIEMGLPGNMAERIAGTANSHGYADASKLLEPELVDELSLCGTPARCKARLRRYLDAGIDHPLLFPEPQSIDRLAKDSSLAHMQ